MSNNVSIITESSESSEKKSENSTTNYVILQNDYYHTKVRELENEVYNLSKQVENLENDNESLEISRDNLKGYVRNQGEFNRLSKNLVEIYDTSINRFRDLRNEFEWNVKFLGFSFIVLELCLFLINFDIIKMLILNAIGCYIAMTMYRSYAKIVEIANVTNNKEVLKIKKEMEEASKGNDYLNKLIDII